MSILRLAAFHVVVWTTAVLLVGVQPTDAKSRPNVVLIVSDDQGFADFGFMGHPHVRTPHLDRLAAQSARFPNAYVPSSVCRPSLVTLLTGLYPRQHGVHFNHPPPGFAKLTRSPEIDKRQYDALRQAGADLIRSQPTLPRLLAGQGYRCLQTGKYWEGHWRNAGFTEGMTLAEPREPANAVGNKRLASGALVAHGNGDHGLAIGRETMRPIERFLADCKQNAKPFFLWYAPFLPHLPHNAPAKFRQIYERDSEVPRHAVSYYAACTWFDDTVGQLIEQVEQAGLAKETVFVFVIDNGFTPDPTRPMANKDFNYTKRSKRSPFDDGLRTPILIRWDGRTKPATHEGLCSSVDIAPTLLEAVQRQEELDTLPGRSLWPAAVGRRPLPSKPVFGAIYPGDASVLGQPERDVAYRWVRAGRYKLIVPHASDNKSPWGGYLKQPAMFDLQSDPEEQINLFNDPRHVQTARELTSKLNDWWNPSPP